jgi:hypothetical protein
MSGAMLAQVEREHSHNGEEHECGESCQFVYPYHYAQDYEVQPDHASSETKHEQCQAFVLLDELGHARWPDAFYIGK